MTKLSHPFSRFLMLPFFRLFIKKVTGLENIPLQGPYLIACKHIGALDAVFIAAKVIPIVNQKVHFISNIAPWGWWWQKIVAERWAGCIPHDRHNPQSCLEAAMRKFEENKIVGIFPEGVMTERDAQGYRAKTGIARLAIWSKMTILPVGMGYVYPIRGKLYDRWRAIGYYLTHPRSLFINFGKPFTLSEYYSQPTTKELLSSATNKVMDQLEELSRQV